MRQNAMVERRSLSRDERERLHHTVGKMDALRTERRSASPARRQTIDTEIRKLNDQCERIIEPVA